MRVDQKTFRHTKKSSGVSGRAQDKLRTWPQSSNPDFVIATLFEGDQFKSCNAEFSRVISEIVYWVVFRSIPHTVTKYKWLQPIYIENEPIFMLWLCVTSVFKNQRIWVLGSQRSGFWAKNALTEKQNGTEISKLRQRTLNSFKSGWLQHKNRVKKKFQVSSINSHKCATLQSSKCWNLVSNSIRFDSNPRTSESVHRIEV